jgi:hypothetical protein
MPFIFGCVLGVVDQPGFDAKFSGREGGGGGLGGTRISTAETEFIVARTSDPPRPSSRVQWFGGSVVQLRARRLGKKSPFHWRGPPSGVLPALLVEEKSLLGIIPRLAKAINQSSLELLERRCAAAATIAALRYLYIYVRALVKILSRSRANPCGCCLLLLTAAFHLH